MISGKDASKDEAKNQEKENYIERRLINNEKKIPDQPCQGIVQLFRPCYIWKLRLNDTFSETVSTILERKVRGWLSGVIEDMRRSSPVQQWLDSLPAEAADDTVQPAIVTDTLTVHANSEESKSDATVTGNTVIVPADDKTIVGPTENSSHEDKSLDVPVPKETWKRKSFDSTVLTSTPQRNVNKLQRDYSIQSEGHVTKFKNPLLRDHSLQSDASGSSGSSVLNVLGARKVDAESVLLALGFGPSEKQQKLQRIPDRFLVPSKLKGISTEKFIKDEHHSMRMHDCGVFGYRGLTGNPHVPPSTIVAKIMECILQDDTCREDALMKARHSIADMRTPAIHARLAAASRLRHN